MSGSLLSRAADIEFSYVHTPSTGDLHSGNANYEGLYFGDLLTRATDIGFVIAYTLRSGDLHSGSLESSGIHFGAHCGYLLLIWPFTYVYLRKRCTGALNAKVV